MQLIDMIEVERNLSETPQGLNLAQFERNHSDIAQGLNVAQSQGPEQTQKQCEEKSRSQDTLDHFQIEVKDVKSVDGALLLLRSLRDCSQISDSAHESLFQAFMLLFKDKEEPAAHSDKEDVTQSPSKRRIDAEMLDETVLRSARIHSVKRKSVSRPFKHPSSKRKQLTSEEAAEIYLMRPKVAKGSFFRRGCMAKSKMIGPHFGVAAKTIRDIWHGRTWVSATRHLWTHAEIALRAKGVVESDDEDTNDSPGSASPTHSLVNMNLQNLSHNVVAGQFTSLPAISLRDQALLPALRFQLPFASSTPSALAHCFSSVGQQQAAMSGLLFNELAQQHLLGFARCHPSVEMGAHSLILPEVSPSMSPSLLTLPVSGLPINN